MDKNISKAIDVLHNVVNGHTTMDNQTAFILEKHIVGLEEKALKLELVLLENKDKLHRRNMLIKDLKKKLKQYNEEVDPNNHN